MENQVWTMTNRRFKSIGFFHSHFISCVVAWLLLSACLCVAQNIDAIHHYKTQFPAELSNPFYFKDSETLLVSDNNQKLWRSEDEGKTWTDLKEFNIDTFSQIIVHPHIGNSAFVLGPSTLHRRTEDGGKSWSEFKTPIVPIANSFMFHARRPNYIMMLGQKCDSSNLFCHREAFYSKDSGNNWSLLRTYIRQCLWGVYSLDFGEMPENSIMCTEWKDKSGSQVSKSSLDLVLSYSNDFFASSNTIVFENTVERGIVGMGVISEFFLVAVKKGSLLDLYSSKDGRTFVNTEFPENTGLKENGYTVLESSARAIVMDVFSGQSGSSNSMGNLFFSDSNGQYFISSLQNTNRNSNGNVDFEKVQGIEGVILANVVSNPEAIAGPFSTKKIQSRISFNDGGSWTFLRPPSHDAEGHTFSCRPETNGDGNTHCALHLHSFTSPHNLGYIFSDAAAPGIVLGVGNVGNSLLPYDDCDLFVSTDGGINWNMVLVGAHKHEVGDSGSLFVAIDDEKATDTIRYSYDYGATWKSYKLDVTIRVKYLFNDPSSTSSKFILIGSEDKQTAGKTTKYVIQLDFSGLFSRTCDLNENNPQSSSDFEQWTARSINSDLACLFGHKQTFYRRKKDTMCALKRRNKIPIVKKENCECTDENFECDYGYIKNGEGKCVSVAKEKPAAGECRLTTDTYMGSSGYRKVPGDTCVGGFDKSQRVKKACSEAQRPGDGTFAGLGPVQKVSKDFNTLIMQHYYLPRSDSSGPVVLLRDSASSLWRSDDEGASWTLISLEGDRKPMIIRLHDHVPERIFIFTTDFKLFYSSDKAKTFSQIILPADPGFGKNLIDFHPTEPDWLLFIGQTQTKSDTRNNAYFSSDNGKKWNDKFDEYVEKCLFAQDNKFVTVEKKSVYCLAYHQKFGNQQGFDHRATTSSGNVLGLYKYDDFGSTRKELLVERVTEFYVFERFMAVAVESGSNIRLMISTDGKTLSEAEFPSDVTIAKEGFTILQSTTGSVFADALSNSKPGSQFGNLFTSNSNGTRYSLSLAYTNRNRDGFVDFEKLQGVDGIILVNRVKNYQEALQGGVKKLETVISFTDGGKWVPIPSPEKDSNGNVIDCKSLGSDGCRLHFHGRTSMTSIGPIFSAKSAPGVVMGVGNVGPNLLDYSNANTYLSRDGGLSWKEIRKGPHRFEFGNYGGLLVMIDDANPTDTLLYSWNDGSSWSTFKFSDSKVRVSELTTETSYASMKFLIIGTVVENHNANIGDTIFGNIASMLNSAFNGFTSSTQVVIHIDFSKVTADKKCRFSNDGSADFELWNPSKDDKQNCILGQQVSYWRRKATSFCYIADDLTSQKNNVRNCDCDPDDFECRPFAKRETDGKCVVAIRHPDEPLGCKQGEKFTALSAYRRIPMSKCQSTSADLDKTMEFTCTGKPPTWSPPTNSEPAKGGSKVTQFDGKVIDIIYAEGTQTGIILRTSADTIWKSSDDGANFQTVDFKNVRISSLMQNPYKHDHIYFVTSGKFHFYTTDKGANLNSLTTPLESNSFSIDVLQFHPEEDKWILFVGDKDCPGSNCRAEAHFSQDRGMTWKRITDYVSSCSWGRDSTSKGYPKETIFCGVYRTRSGNQKSKFSEPIDLYRSDDYFDKSTKLLDDINGFAITEGFMAVATYKSQDRSHMDLFASLDGSQLTKAVFPSDVAVTYSGYTVLESSSGSIFVDVYTNPLSRREYGSLLISNYNGTFYSRSLEATNRDSNGYVDYERMLGLNGIMVINQVTNVKGTTLGEEKKLRTLMTYDAGLSWRLLRPPLQDVQGGSIACAVAQKGLPVKDDCALHFHSYTERKSIRNEMSDPNAIGIFIGIGHIGRQLGSFESANTYLTRDAGATWQEVRQGPHLFEFADHGGIIVLAHATKPIRSIWYSYDLGASFKEYVFHDTIEISAERFLTEPDSTSQKLILFGTDIRTGKYLGFYLNLQSERPRACKHYKDTSDSGDFELWTVMDPGRPDDNCFFGEVKQFYRRKQSSICSIEEQFLNTPTIVKQCDCRREDYECEVGYTLQEGADKVCTLMPGYSEQWGPCENNGMKVKLGAYHKRAMSKCSGGMELDRDVKNACAAGKLSGIATAAIVLVVLAVVAVALWWAAKKWIVFGNGYGRIRLDDVQEEARGLWTRLKDRLRTLVERFRPKGSYSRLNLDDDMDVLLDDYEPPRQMI